MDETGINMIPAGAKSFAPTGSKQVPGSVKKSRSQISKVTMISLEGELLPYQLIFTGKTQRSVPLDVEPTPGSKYTQSPSHFATVTTQLELVNQIIVPYVKNKRLELYRDQEAQHEEDNTVPAVLIWDNHSTHLDKSVVDLLNQNHIFAFPLPANCTSKYQPLDALFNGLEKRHLIANFSEWHIQALQAHANPDEAVVDVLPGSVGGKRSLIATLVKKVHLVMQKRQDLILKSWKLTGLLPVPNASDIEMPTDTTFDESIVSELHAVSLRHGAPQNEEEEVVDLPAWNSASASVGNENRQVNLLEDEFLDSFTSDNFAVYESESDLELSSFEEASEDHFERRRLVHNAKMLQMPISDPKDVVYSVYLDKGLNYREIIVKYDVPAKLSPEQVTSALLRDGRLSQDARISDAYDETDKSFKFQVDGQDRTSVVGPGGSFHWSPYTAAIDI